MLKRIFGNLWFWVVSAFVLIILAWALTIRIASRYQQEPLPEGTTLERQAPEN